MKKLLNYVVITVLATTLLSCDDIFTDRDDRFDSAIVQIESTASLDLLEVADVEFTVTDAQGKVHTEKMETLQWKNSITNIKSLPASTQLSVKVTLKDGFVSVDGDELDLDFKVSYSVQVIDRGGEVDEDRKGTLYNISAKGVKSENLTNSFKIIFPKDKVYGFSIKEETRDKDDYIINVDELD